MPSMAWAGVRGWMRPARTSSICCCSSARRRSRCAARRSGSASSAVARLSISRCTVPRREAVEVIMRLSSWATKRSAVFSASVSNRRPSRSVISARRIHSRSSRRACAGVSCGSIWKSLSLACAASRSARACTATSNGTPSRWCSKSASRQLRMSGARGEASSRQAGCCWRASRYFCVRCWLRVDMGRPVHGLDANRGVGERT